MHVYDLGRDGARFWIAMELLRGETLADRLDRGPLLEPELGRVFTQLLEVLQHVHQAGIVHRDLKPQNIFLERDAVGDLHVPLLDFGIAKLSDSRLGAYATPFGFALGTLGYMAPEQATNATTADVRADIYAVGVMLYECISCELPFPPALNQLASKQPTHRSPALPLEPSAHPYAPTALACLALNRQRRPSSCVEVLQALALARRKPLTGSPTQGQSARVRTS